MRLPQLPAAQLPPQGDIERVVAELSKPANPAWCMARVAALLSPYYDRDTPQAIREMEAEDWLAALSGLPEWAINEAVRWWKGPDNPKRHKRPMEGDIAEHAGRAFRNVCAVPKLTANRPKPAERPVVPPEDMERRRAVADEVMARFRTGNRS